MLPWVPITGPSGREYSYRPYERFGSWLDVPANYAFAYINRLIGGWTILYFGEAANIRDRMYGHDRWFEAISLGATHVLGHVSSPAEAVRRAEERDLTQRYNPILNTQHRTTSAPADLLSPNPLGLANPLGLGFGLGSPWPHGKL